MTNRGWRAAGRGTARGNFTLPWTIPDSRVPAKTYGMNPSVNVREESKGDGVRSNTSTVKTTAEMTVPVIAMVAAAKSARNSGLASAAA